MHKARRILGIMQRRSLTLWVHGLVSKEGAKATLRLRIVPYAPLVEFEGPLWVTSGNLEPKK